MNRDKEPQDGKGQRHPGRQIRRMRVHCKFEQRHYVRPFANEEEARQFLAALIYPRAQESAALSLQETLDRYPKPSRDGRANQ